MKHIALILVSFFIATSALAIDQDVVDYCRQYGQFDACMKAHYEEKEIPEYKKNEESGIKAEDVMIFVIKTAVKIIL